MRIFFRLLDIFYFIFWLACFWVLLGTWCVLPFCYKALLIWLTPEYQFVIVLCLCMEPWTLKLVGLIMLQLLELILSTSLLINFFPWKLTLILQYKPETCELKARKGDKVRVHYRVRVWYSCKFVFIIEFIIVKWYLPTKCNSSAWIRLILSINKINVKNLNHPLICCLMLVLNFKSEWANLHG